ncbi:hypothetical protein [Beduini massiliensis]|uniref:hypothetical protein n=1 Tax=Beduini massiliensis TaxID=1585974 RepID=UPI0012E0484E|nr:hypothetical protein [Beduini massiliensis]
MSVTFASIALACLVVIAVCSIVFPIIFIVSFNRFRKEMKQTFEKRNLEEVKDEI